MRILTRISAAAVEIGLGLGLLCFFVMSLHAQAVPNPLPPLTFTIPQATVPGQTVTATITCQQQQITVPRAGTKLTLPPPVCTVTLTTQPYTIPAQTINLTQHWQWYKAADGTVVIQPEAGQ